MDSISYHLQPFHPKTSRITSFHLIREVCGCTSLKLRYALNGQFYLLVDALMARFNHCCTKKDLREDARNVRNNINSGRIRPITVTEAPPPHFDPCRRKPPIEGVASQPGAGGRGYIEHCSKKP
jgi:hypothetical protein